MTDEVGRNIWDEVWEVGGFDSSSGMPVIQRNTIRTPNFIPVNPFEEYCVSISRGLYIFVYLYDKSGTFIFNAGRKDNGDIITIPNNAYLLKFETSSVYGETYINDICINKSDSQNGTYTPSRGLRKRITEVSNEALDIKMLGWAVPKELGISNYVDSNRKFHQRVGRINLGSIIWGYAYDAGYQYYPLSDIPNLKTTTLYLNGYTFVSDTAGWALMPNMSIKKHHSNTTNWRIRDDRYTTVSEFKTAMQNAYLYYELANEIVTDVDGNEAIVNPLSGDLLFIAGDVNWNGIPEIFTIEQYSMYIVFASTGSQSAIYIVNGVGEIQAAVVKLAGDDLVSFSFNEFTVTANVNQYCAYAIYRLATNKT